MTESATPFRIVSSVANIPSSAGRLIALTYDDGPSEWTAGLLDVLRAAEAQATFFVIGEHIDGYEDVLERAAAEGHEIGNHMFTHPRPDFAPDNELEAQIVRTSRRIASVLGRAPQLMRSPCGEAEDRVAPLAARHGMPTTVHWSISPSDWRESKSDVIVQRVLSGAVTGAIVCLHDGKPSWVQLRYPSREPTVYATAEIVASLSRDGYRFVTVSELIAAAY